MASNTYSIVTEYRRESLCKITSGAITSLPAITHVVLGNGGLEEDGSVKVPDAKQTALNNELGRYKVDEPQYPVPATARYTVNVPEADLVGEVISEAALADSEGNLCAIRNMLPKGKDEGVEFTFTFDDEF